MNKKALQMKNYFELSNQKAKMLSIKNKSKNYKII